jgi:hypothetical protein
VRWQPVGVVGRGGGLPLGQTKAQPETNAGAHSPSSGTTGPSSCGRCWKATSVQWQIAFSQWNSPVSSPGPHKLRRPMIGGRV